MSWFQLDPDSVVARVKASGKPPFVPTLADDVVRGLLGFTIVSVAGFAPWAVGGRWFSQNLGEAGLYAVCAVVFIGLSGLLMHRLIIGPGSLARFYKLFGVAFAAYAVLWIVGWMLLRGHRGSVLGLLAGTAVMGALMVCAFDAKKVIFEVIGALFVLNAVGYFVGGWVEGAAMHAKELPLLGSSISRSTHRMIAMLLWGVFYGIGFGAGLGLAFRFCQQRTRLMLNEFVAKNSGNVS
jgi:hypothetical protein